MRSQRPLFVPMCILTAAGVFLWPSSSFASDISIQMPALRPTNTSSTSFSPVQAGQVTRESLLELSPRIVVSDKQLFVVEIDTGSFGRIKYNRFQFDLYVMKLGDTNAQRFTVYEDPVGVFTDYLASVSITITQSEASDTATLTAIPIHANYEGDVFSLKGDGKPFNVGLGGISSIYIPVVSNLSDFQATINSVDVSSTRCPGCWIGQLTAKNDPIVQPSGSLSLNLTLRANTLQALFASALAVNTDKSHDVLAISIQSTPTPGGTPTLPQKIIIPVRFTPSFFYLASAVILGSLIGVGVRMLIPMATAAGAAAPEPAAPQGRLPKWASDLLFSFATAALVEFVGLILFNYSDTKVVVFGFSLDPSQVAPACLISILVAGGRPVVSLISDKIKI